MKKIDFSISFSVRIMSAPIVPQFKKSGLGNQMGCVAIALLHAKLDYPERQVIFSDNHSFDTKGIGISDHTGAKNEDVFEFWPRLQRMCVPNLSSARRIDYNGFEVLAMQTFHKSPEVSPKTPILVSTKMGHHLIRSFEALGELIQRFGVLPSLRLPVSQTCKGMCDQDLKNCLFVHIRRGDYLGNSLNFIDLHKSFYRRAFRHFFKQNEGKKDIDKTMILVCSDDIKWCQKHMPQKYSEIPISAWRYCEADPRDTLVLMAKCGLGGILANSSLSWWGMMLSKYLGSSNRHFVGPNIFLRNLWPININTMNFSRVLPSWCFVELVEDGAEDVSYGYVYGVLLCLSCLFLAIFSWKAIRLRQTN